MPVANLPAVRACRPAWNKGRIVGQKRPLLPKHVWAIRVRLEIARSHRDLALFNLAIDSKLRGCDLVRLMVADVYCFRPGSGADVDPAEKDRNAGQVRADLGDQGVDRTVAGGPPNDRFDAPLAGPLP